MIYCNIEMEEYYLAVSFSDSFWVNPNINLQKKIQDLTGVIVFALPDKSLLKLIEKNIDNSIQKYLNKKQISLTEKKYWEHYFKEE